MIRRSNKKASPMATYVFSFLHFCYSKLSFLTLHLIQFAIKSKGFHEFPEQSFTLPIFWHNFIFSFVFLIGPLILFGMFLFLAFFYWFFSAQRIRI